MNAQAKIGWTPFIIGFFLWAIGGGIIAMAGFQSVASQEMISTNKELASQVVSGWGHIWLNTILIWGLIGGVLGKIILWIFIHQPDYKHYTRMPTMEGMPVSTGPKTLAETHTLFISVFLGVVVSILMAIIYLPSLETELLEVKSSGIRIIIAAIEGLVVTTPILPFSLKILTKRHERRN